MIGQGNDGIVDEWNNGCSRHLDSFHPNSIIPVFQYSQFLKEEIMSGKVIIYGKAG
jgi:hypothetical protein